MNPGAASLIVGLDGQDGAYLSRRLLSDGGRVAGTWLDPESMTRNFAALGMAEGAVANERFLLPATEAEWLALLDRHAPDEVYLLAGITSVGLSFAKPADTVATSVGAVTTLLEAMRTRHPKLRLFYAGSVECFGEVPGGLAADEETPFRPYCNPYAVGKAAAMHMIRLYREAYGLYVCSGILAPHESPLRPPGFVTRKIVDGARAVAAGRLERLELGNLEVWRDWGWAEEYVDAYVAMLRREKPADYVLATGETHSLREYVELAFRAVGVEDWERRVVSKADHLRPRDVLRQSLDPGRAARELGWKARVGFGPMVEMLVRGRCSAKG